MKKIGLLLIIIITVVFLTLSASAESYQDYEYAVLNNETVKITGYVGSESAITIPSVIDGMSVTEIGNSAFYENTVIESVIIPDSVTKIGKFSFSNCESLSEVIIGENVTYIGARAFEYTGLKSVVIPDSVERMGGYVFSDCSSLKELTIGKNVERIPSYAFSDCINLVEVIIPDKTKEIGEKAFWCCDALDTVVIGESVIDIEYGAFASCINLKNLTLNDKVEVIGEGAFAACAITSVEIPDSVKQIAESAFEQCVNLESITISDCVTSIGVDAFLDTRFYDNKDNWEDNVLYIGKHLIKAQRSVSGEYEIKENTLTIADGAFMQTKQLTSVKIPETITAIPYGAFMQSAIETVELPNSITSIGYYAFAGCSNLKTINIPNSVTFIDDCAFASCIALESITIPDSVTELGQEIFVDTAYYKNPANWENGILYIDNHLISVVEDFVGECVIKEGTKNIATGAITGVDIATLVLPSSLENIGYASIFEADIESFSIDESNEYFTTENGVLFNKDKTKLIAYPSAKNDNFYICPDSLKEVNAGAFHSASNLEVVLLNEGLEFIGEWAFDYVEAIYVPDSVNVIGNDVFGNYDYIFYEGSADEYEKLLRNTVFGRYYDGENIDEIFAGIEYDFTAENLVAEMSVYCGSEYYPAVEAITCQDQGSTYGIYVPLVESWYVEPETITGDHIYNNSLRFCDVCGEENILTSGVCGETCTFTLYADGILEIEGTGVITEEIISLLDEEHYVKVSSVIIHDGITGIGDGAFAEMQLLKSVEIPDSVTSIGEGAFYLCYCLRNITIPQSVEYVGQLAFGICISLGDVYFYPTDAEIGLGAFGLSDCCIDESKISVEEFWETYYLAMDYYFNGEEERGYEIIEQLVECIIMFDDAYILESTIIHCYKNSTVEAYAKEWGVNHVNFPSHEHSYAETVITEPTCKKTGVMEYKCDCGDVYTEDIPKTTVHTYNCVITAPTCTAQGYTTYTCDVCGDSYISDYIKENGHTHNSVVTAPTCNAQGYTTYSCECGDCYKSDYVDSLNHKDDNNDYICDYNCGYEFEKPTPEKPDTPDEPVVPDTPVEPEEELSFFEKIVEWFKNIFEKFFGWLKF